MALSLSFLTCKATQLLVTSSETWLGSHLPETRTPCDLGQGAAPGPQCALLQEGLGPSLKGLLAPQHNPRP